MPRISRLVLMACAAGALLALAPAELHAQRRGRVHVVRPAVAIGVHYSRPFYPAYWQPYPYPYPYPYRYGYFDYRSSLRIQNTPPEAEVFVDGYFVGIVDDFDGWAQRLHLEPGEHEIAIYLEGFRTRRTPMLFRPDQSYKLNLGLEPLGPGEAQEPRPTPSGPPRSRGGYERPGTAAALGTLSLRIQPADATVLIDGERWEWPSGSDRLVVDVPEGTRRIEVRREGHEPYETTVAVRRGETTTLNISLPRR